MPRKKMPNLKGKPYTKDMLLEFDRIMQDTESRNPMRRLTGRLDLAAFVNNHGKPLCDEMWEIVKEW